MSIFRSIDEMPAFAVAIIAESNVIHYRKLGRMVDVCAHLLRTNGIGQSETIGLTVFHPINRLLASLALFKMGAGQIELPIKSSLKQSMADAGVDTIVTDQKLMPTDAKSIRIDWLEIQRSEMASDPMEFSGGHAGSFLNLGSGTTGKKKLIKLSGLEFEEQIAREMLARPIRQGERFLSVPLLDFMIAKRAIYACLEAGGTVVFPRRDLPVEDACDLYAVDHLLMVVVQAHRLLTSVSCGRTKPSARLPRLKSLTVRSSPVSEKLRKGLRQFVSPNTWIAYGTNEFGTASVALPGDQQAHAGSIGPALPGVRLEIVDEDDGPLPAGEVGNIRMQASGMFSGYLGSIEETAAALKDGWFYPKDLGSLSKKGVITFHGRSDDMIIFGGSNIMPREIELALERHDAVAAVAALSLPSESHGEIPVAAVTLKQEVSEKQLLAHCQNLIGQNAPLRIFFLPRMPRNLAGKILKDEIRNMLANQKNRKEK